MTIREFVGVLPNEKWPRWTPGMAERKDPHSGLTLLTPNFEAHVHHPANMRLLHSVAKKVWDEYKVSVD